MKGSPKNKRVLIEDYQDFINRFKSFKKDFKDGPAYEKDQDSIHHSIYLGKTLGEDLEKSQNYALAQKVYSMTSAMVGIASNTTKRLIKKREEKEEDSPIQRMRYIHEKEDDINKLDWTQRDLSSRVDELNQRRISRIQSRKYRNIEQKVSAIIGIGSLGVSLFFLSSNLTGNAIGNLESQSSNLIGVGLLFISLVSGVFLMRRRK